MEGGGKHTQSTFVEFSSCLDPWNRWSSEDICKITGIVIYVGKLKKLVPPCALPLATRFYQETEKTGGNAEDDSSSSGGHAALLRQPALTSSLLPSGRPLKRQRRHTKK